MAAERVLTEESARSADRISAQNPGGAFHQRASRGGWPGEMDVAGRGMG